MRRRRKLASIDACDIGLGQFQQGIRRPRRLQQANQNTLGLVVRRKVVLVEAKAQPILVVGHLRITETVGHPPLIGFVLQKNRAEELGVGRTGAARVGARNRRNHRTAAFWKLDCEGWRDMKNQRHKTIGQQGFHMHPPCRIPKGRLCPRLRRWVGH
ncbi:MAG: hypothetical protein BWZ07_03364 [Alphaproteobacteria bacterium ADurb.BinA280]|nr:MAG: hypothetical protein BWZ07_03364 [Alphaproteobacteria bacterium ADurb.BinA280]